MFFLSIRDAYQPLLFDFILSASLQYLNVFSKFTSDAPLVKMSGKTERFFLLSFPSLAKYLLIPSHLEKFPPLNKVSCYNIIETSFLAVEKVTRSMAMVYGLLSLKQSHVVAQPHIMTT